MNPYTKRPSQENLTVVFTFLEEAQREDGFLPTLRAFLEYVCDSPDWGICSLRVCRPIPSKLQLSAQVGPSRLTPLLSAHRSFFPRGQLEVVDASSREDAALLGDLPGLEQLLPRRNCTGRRKIYIKVHSTHTREDLLAYFSTFGEIEKLELKVDYQTKKPRNFGYLTMKVDKNASEVVNHPCHYLMGKYILCEFSNPSEKLKKKAKNNLFSMKESVLKSVESYLNCESSCKSDFEGKDKRHLNRQDSLDQEALYHDEAKTLQENFEKQSCSQLFRDDCKENDPNLLSNSTADLALFEKPENILVFDPNDLAQPQAERKRILKTIETRHLDRDLLRFVVNQKLAVRPSTFRRLLKRGHNQAKLPSKRLFTYF